MRKSEINVLMIDKYVKIYFNVFFFFILMNVFK